MGKVNKGIMSSNSSEWETPQDLFDWYDVRFNFELDVCATEKNKKVIKYYDKKKNGLNQPWSYSNWMNPPYGSGIYSWVKKAYEESLKGNLTVCLLPARTDTKWWQEFVMKADHILFIKGRLKFSGQKYSAPFPSAIAIFGLDYRR